MADLNVSLVMKLVDRVSGPAKRAADQVARMGQRMEETGARNIERANRIAERSERLQSGLQRRALGVAAIGYAFSRAIQPAIAFETSMAEISKVVDFKTPEGFKTLAADVHRLVTDGGLPVAASGIMDIVAAAGRMGVVNENLPDAEKSRQLIAFAESAAKMGIAFGISAGEAGEAMARLRSNLDLSQQKVVLLGDAINLLGNTMATNEADILRVVSLNGTIAKTAGLAATETAALAATILAAGAAPERAGTGMKNFLNALTRGESMTDRQAAVMQKLGFNATEMAERMQVDAKGAILDVIEAFGRLDKADLNARIGDLFGEEAKAAITPLIDNVEALRTAFDKTGDAANFAGGMLEEYARQAGTTAAKFQLLKNRTTAMATVIGAELLPMLNDMMAAIGPVISQIAGWAAANPELVETIGWAAAGLVGFKVATLALGFAFLPLIRMSAMALRAVGLLRAGMGIFAARSAMMAPMVVGSFSLIASGIKALALATILSPIGLSIAAIAAGAHLIYQNWDGISAYFTDKMAAVHAAFETGFGSGLKAIFTRFDPATLMGDYTAAFYSYLNAEIKGWFGVDLAAQGSALIASLKSGVMSVLPGMVASIKTWLDGLLPDWVKKAYDYVSGASTPARTSARPDYNGTVSGGSGPGPAGKRALGGGVRAGFAYQINEEGQEFFRPHTSGEVITARAARGGEATGARSVRFGDIVINAGSAIDAREVADLVMREIDNRMDDAGAALHDGGHYAG